MGFGPGSNDVRVFPAILDGEAVEIYGAPSVGVLQSVGRPSAWHGVWMGTAVGRICRGLCRVHRAHPVAHEQNLGDKDGA